MLVFPLVVTTVAVSSLVLGASAANYWRNRARFGKLDRHVSRANLKLTKLSRELKELREFLKRQDLDRTAEVQAIGADLTAVRQGARDIERRTGALFDHVVDVHTGFGYISAISTLLKEYPTFFAGVALDGHTARALFEQVELHRPKVILELGSGSSTVLLGALLDKLGISDTRHISVDDSAYYLDATKQRYARYKFKHQVEFLHCPLQKSDGDPGPAWYGGLVEKLGDTKIDLVLVDGPPGAFHPRSRQPALERLLPYLSETAVVILDDTNRDEEQAILREWRKLAPDMKFSRGHRGKGFAIVSRR